MGLVDEQMQGSTVLDTKGLGKVREKPRAFTPTHQAGVDNRRCIGRTDGFRNRFAVQS